MVLFLSNGVFNVWSFKPIATQNQQIWRQIMKRNYKWNVFAACDVNVALCEDLSI